jgi:hypothetical protein
MLSLSPTAPAPDAVASTIAAHKRYVRIIAGCACGAALKPSATTKLPLAARGVDSRCERNAVQSLPTGLYALSLAPRSSPQTRGFSSIGRFFCILAKCACVNSRTTSQIYFLFVDCSLSHTMSFLAAPPEGFLQATEAVTRLPPTELELLVRARRGRRRCFCVPPLQPIPRAHSADTAYAMRCQALQVCKFLLQRNGSLSLEDIATKASQSVGAPRPRRACLQMLAISFCAGCGRALSSPRVRRRAGDAAWPRAYGMCKGLAL